MEPEIEGPRPGESSGEKACEPTQRLSRPCLGTGTVEPRIPTLHKGGSFPPAFLEPGRMAEDALTATV
jgi:hypothetical protein